MTVQTEKKYIVKKKIPLFTFGGIHRAKASGAEQMPGTSTSNKSVITGLSILAYLRQSS